MPNNQWERDSQLDSEGRFKFTYTADQANSPNNWMVLLTQNKFMDKNIFVQAIVPQGVLSSGNTTIETNTSVSSLLTEVSSTPSSGPYMTVTSSGSVTVSTAGWIASGASSASTTKIYKITAGAYSASTDTTAQINGTVTPSVGLNNNAGTYGFTQTQPTGTNGTSYLTIDPGASVDQNWSITPKASITTAGYLATGSKNGTAVSGAPTINNGTNYYIPIVTATVGGGGLTPTNFTKNDLAVTLAAGTTAANRNMSNYNVGAKNTTTYPYFFEIVGSTPAVEGTTKVTRGAITLTNDAGAIAEHAGTTEINGTSSSPTVNVNAATGSTYFSLKAAAATVSASTAKPTIEKITSAVSGKTQILSDVTLVNSSPANSISTYYIAVKGFSGAVTNTKSGTFTAGYFAGTGQITANGVAAKNQSDIYYLPVPTATFSKSGATVSCATGGYVPAGALPQNGTISNGTMQAVTSDPGSGYTEITSNVSISSGGWLKIGAGYYANSKISLATLIADNATVGLAAGYILNGYKAYDNAGTLITGSILTYDGAFSVE